MELSEENQLMKVAEPSSYESLLECQKDLFLNQVENLQYILATQCQLTGINPLAQEMAAGALSIKIGKKPRDLLNPKAVKYMQYVFSIKDALSKSETREISAQFGITVTQVREFFASQRTRVRNFARLSSVKVDKPVCLDAMPVNMASTSDPNVPAEPIPLYIVAPMAEEPSCAMKQEVLPGMEEGDRKFTENIFRLMRKEESFAGQIKLLQWILRTETPSVLTWFLTEGGVLIIATWLSEAAAEEQTSVLRLILKVLSYLPLRKALPAHMSAVLQSVNTLRFYRTPDVSNRSRVLLAQWSNTILKGIALNKSRAVGDAQDEMLLKQSVDEVMGDQSWDMKDDSPEEALRLLTYNTDSQRKLDPIPSVKLLTAPEDDASKKRGVLPSHARGRRKIQMVDHPGQKLAARPQVAKSTVTIKNRPLSADEIQKAKMRAQLLQSCRNGKTITASNNQVKPEPQHRGISSPAKISVSATTHYDQVKPESHNRDISLPAEVSTSVTTHDVLPGPEEGSKDENLASRLHDQAKPQSHNRDISLTDEVSASVSTHNVLPAPEELIKAVNPPEALNVDETPRKKQKRNKTPWQAPPEVKIMEEWQVGNGNNSKEVEIQRNRIKREREIIYRNSNEISSNPREPWDREMDYDDSLTPRIPIEQLPDNEPVETPTASGSNQHMNASSSSSNMPEPDLQLLAELLKNPQLVFALTSGQAGDLSSSDTLRLLDVIKSNGASLNGTNNSVEVSLPSPTPSSDVARNGMKFDYSRNPFSRQNAMTNGNTYQAPQTVIQTNQSVLSSTFIQPQIQHMVNREQWHTVNTPNTQLMNLENTNYNAYSSGSSAHLNYNQVAQLSPYTQEPSIRHSFESTQYNYQNNVAMNDYNLGYGQQGRAWDSRANVVDKPGYELWSPNNSPTRQHEYIPGRNYQESRGHVYKDPSLSGIGNKRWRDDGR